MTFKDRLLIFMTFQDWKMKCLNSMTFQVFHDLYKPRHMERKFQGGEQSKAKVPSVGKNPLPISLLSYYSLKIKFVPCHHVYKAMSYRLD